MGKYNTALSVVVGLLVLTYFCVYASACPSPELIRAIILEVVVFIVVLFFKFKGSRSKSGRLENMVMHELSDKWASLKFARRAGNAIVLTCWIAATIILSIDLCALLGAVSGNTAVSRFIYTTFPNSVLPGVHPAYSLEVLTGAYIEAAKYDRARTMADELLWINRKLSGENSEAYASAIGTLSKIYVKEGRFAEAEIESRKALAISRRVLGQRKMGQILTLVADNLRDQGKYKEAQNYYLEALQMRQEQFGPRSVKVAETSRAYAKMLNLAGDTAGGAIYQKSADAILKFHERKDDGLVNLVLTVVLFLISISASKLLFGPKGYLTKMAMRRLEANIQGQAVSTEDVKKLIKFYEHQKNPAQIERYETMLRKLAAD